MSFLMFYTNSVSARCILCAFRELELSSGRSLIKESIRLKSYAGNPRIKTNVKQQRNSSGNSFRRSRDNTNRDRKEPKQPGQLRIRRSEPRWMRSGSSYGLFGELLLNELHQLKQFLTANTNRTLGESWGIQSARDMELKLSQFRNKLIECISMAEEGRLSKTENPLFYRFRQAFVAGNINALKQELKYSFLSSVVSKDFSQKQKTRLEELADLRYPAEWYPSTRSLQRTVHLHVGPTNSGKTYHALKRLEAVENGVYAGPLRLLAHEVYSRFNNKGKLCGLITGEEKRIPPNLANNMYSCTVEMIPLNVLLDVAVIDEIQMLTSPDRGWAWTTALLGVQAKEVHLCGEVRTTQIIKDLCALLGDKLVIHEYERLSPLEVEKESIKGDLTKLRKGDAIILFSRLAIHGMKQGIEKATGKRCAVVYGSLPPETRAQQAALFNDPDNDYDFLVASDAVGMGLNLSIRRVIFESTLKFDGTERRVMETSEIKQIAGRAGRYKTANDDKKNDKIPIIASGLDVPEASVKESTMGLVTTLAPSDFKVVKNSMNIDAPPIITAGITPPAEIVLRFASYFPPSTPFSYILLRLHEISSTSAPFFLCVPRDEISIADLIQPFDIPTRDRLTFTAAPVSTHHTGIPEIIKEFAACLADQSGGELLKMKTLKLELLDVDINDHHQGPKGYLREAEALHKALTLYLWLSYRFAGVFISQTLAFHVKGLIEAKIDECLAVATYNPERRKIISEKSRVLQSKEKAVLEAMLDSTAIEEDKRFPKMESSPEIVLEPTIV